MKNKFLPLVVALTASVTAGAGFVTPDAALAREEIVADWAADIPAMLAAGDHLQGQVVAGVVSSGRGHEGNEILKEGEEVMDISEAGTDLFGEQIPDDGEVHVLYVQRDDMTTEELLYALAKDDRVVFAEPNYIYDTSDTENTGTSDVDFLIDEDAASLTFADDTDPSNTYVPTIRIEGIDDLTPHQWSSSDNSSWVIEGNTQNSMHVPGFGATGSNMDGDPVVVAVLDDAIDFTHPDLAPVAYTFTPEQQQLLGCDVHGFNDTSESTDGKLVYWDTSTHGTHCAGIIGAAWDGHGISGVASNVRLVSVQTLTNNGYTSLVNALRGLDFIDRANELGCNISVTSNSWSLMQGSRALNAAILNLGEKWGTVSVFASGNQDKDLEYIGDTANTLFDNPYVIVVGALDPEDKRAPYRNFGKNFVDLGAPGSGILSTVCVNDKVSRYFADAVRSTNKFYEGFEEENVSVSVKQTNEQHDIFHTTGIVTDASYFAGNHSLKLPLDTDKAERGIKGQYVYHAELDLGEISGIGAKPGDLVGFTIGANGWFDIGGFSYKDPATGNEEIFIKSSRGGTYSGGWTNAFAELPEEMNISDARIFIDLISQQPMDAVYFDSVGVGTEKVPYDFKDGTSMACPAVSGAVAVIKAANPGINGDELASLVRSKVRKNDSFAEISKTGGVLDFAATGSDMAENVIPDPAKNEKEMSAGSRNVYEEELPIAKSTGEPYIIDAGGDFETNGPLIGLDDKLYYLPDISYVEDNSSFKKMFRFDTKTFTWETLPELPEYLTFVSGVMFEGRIIIKGTTMDILPDGSPALAYEPQEKVYIYDPGAGIWTAGSSEGVGQMDTMSNNNGQLILVGGGGFTEDPVTREDVDEPATVRTYDPSSGAGDVLARLHKAMYRPCVACSNGVIYVFDVVDYTFERVRNGKSELLTNALPKYLNSGAKGAMGKYPHPTEKYGVILPVNEGAMLVGPLAEDGSGDTYLLKEGSDSFEIYEKRMSEHKVSFPAAASYRGYVYAIGTSPLEPGQMFFRRTAMAVPEYAGDVTEDPDDKDDGNKPEDDKPDGDKTDEDKTDGDKTDGDDKNRNGKNTDAGDRSKAGAEYDTPVKKMVVSRSSKAAKTGDRLDFPVWVCVAATGIAGLAAAIVLLRRRHRR